MSEEIQKNLIALRKMVESADLDGIRAMCLRDKPACLLLRDAMLPYLPKPLTFPHKRLIEAFEGRVEGDLADSERERLDIMKGYVPADQNLRKNDWYRRSLGGAWSEWKLSGSWERLLPGGIMWARGWACPLKPELATCPVPELAFSKQSSHRFIRCVSYGPPVDQVGRARGA